MVEQHPDRNVAADRRVGQVRRQRLVEVDTSLIDELQDHRGDERFGDAGDAERCVRSDWIACRVGDTGHRCRCHAVADREHGDPTVLLAESIDEQSVEVVA